MIKQEKKTRKQIQMLCIDELVPEDHMLRKIENAIDWDFIYDLVEDKYSKTHGRPSIDPVTLIEIPMIQYLYGIRSMRQTIKEIEVNENDSKISINGLNDIGGYATYPMGTIERSEFDPEVYDYNFYVYSDPFGDDRVSGELQEISSNLANNLIDAGVIFWRIILEDAGLTFSDLGFTSIAD